MWSSSNERFLDRRGCGDEFYLDAALKASTVLASLAGSEWLDDDTEVDLDDADDAAAH